MRFIADSDELYRDAHSLAGPAHGAFHDVGDTEIAANLLDALRGRFELHRRGSGDHPEMLWAQAGQLGDHFLGQPVAEIVVSIPRSEVLEWQDHEHGSLLSRLPAHRIWLASRRPRNGNRASAR